MINATTARQLVEESEIAIEQMLNSLDMKIREQAIKGQTEYVIYDEGWYESAPCGSPPNKTHKHRALVDKLQRHGFSVTFGAISSSYVPKGLMNDDGSGPEYKNYGITVRW